MDSTTGRTLRFESTYHGDRDEHWVVELDENHKEGIIEMYYNFQLFEHLALSPFMQIVWNPNGVSDEMFGNNSGGQSDTTVTVCGMRSQLDF